MKLLYNPKNGAAIKAYHIDIPGVGAKDYSLEVDKGKWFPDYVAEYLVKVFPFLSVEEENDKKSVFEKSKEEPKEEDLDKADETVKEEVKKEMDGNVEIEGGDRKTYKCKHCTETFTTPLGLARHTKKHKE